MHIAFLTPEYPHERVAHAAGIGTSIKNLVVALSQKGILISVFVYGQAEDAVFWEGTIKIHLIQSKKYPALGWFLHRKWIQKYVNTWIIADKIDLIEAPDWTGITAFMNFKIPLVIRFHGSDTYFCHLEKRKQKRKNFWFEKRAVSKATAFIAPTTYAGTVSKALFGIKNKKIQTIHYGLDRTQFENPAPEKYQKGLLLYIGTIIRKKGVLELPAIFKIVAAHYPDAQLVLIGGDSYDISTQEPSTWELLQNELDDTTRDKVTYLGKIPYQEIQSYIKKAQVCVFPTFAETLGMVTIESMALQKPVVNSNIGWAQELIIDGESGSLVYPKDHQVYAEKIMDYLGSETLCLATGKQAWKRVEKVFDIQKIVVENIEFYQALLKI